MKPTAPWRYGLATFTLLMLSTVAGDALAQIPDEFTNLRVLPKEITKGELIGVMRGMAGALGVRCKHCHVGPDNLQGMDFATDEKSIKKTARTMMRMVREINKKYLQNLETDRPKALEVKCATCHHGLNVPRAIEDVLAVTIEDQDMEAAVEQYRKLRDDNYGTYAYDFSEIPLNSLAERLASAEKLDEALVLLNLNVKYHPDKSSIRMMLGGLHRARGENEQAIASYEMAVKIDPDNVWAKKQLKALLNAE